MQSKKRLIEILNGMKNVTSFVRDEQRVVPCAENFDGSLNYDPDDDICNYFDHIIDDIDDTIEKVKKHGVGG